MGLVKIVDRRIVPRLRKQYFGMGFLRLSVDRDGLVGMCASSIANTHFLIGIRLFRMLVGNRFSLWRLRTNVGFTMIIAVRGLLYSLILCLSV